MNLNGENDRREAVAVALGALKAYVVEDFDLVDRYPETYSGELLTFGMAGLAGSILVQLGEASSAGTIQALKEFNAGRKVRHELNAIIPLVESAKDSNSVPVLDGPKKISVYRWEALCMTGLAGVKVMAFHTGETEEDVVVKLQHGWAGHSG